MQNIQEDIYWPFEEEINQEPDVSEDVTILVVADTNAYFQDLPKICEIIYDVVYENYKLVIPWRVLIELDGLKHSSNPTEARQARRVAHALENWSHRYHHKLMFQNGEQERAMALTFNIEVADDLILQMAINLKNDDHFVTFLSFDRIAILKAISYNIEIFQTHPTGFEHTCEFVKRHVKYKLILTKWYLLVFL